MADARMSGPVDAGRVRALACPSCGAAITLRGLAWTKTVACASCGAVLDARDPNLGVLQQFERAAHIEPAIPLGTRGQWRGAPYEVIGFQIRTITVDDVPYSWREYLLFNPYHGFRYLTEYDGHWNDVVPLPALPVTTTRAGKPTATVGGRTYRHFQTARAATTHVLGEFPWEVRVGDTVEARDYVDPPRLLSAEQSPDEVSWSMGEYADGREIWRAFKLPGSPPSPRGVFANQPSPYAPSGGLWKLFGLFALVLTALMLVRVVTSGGGEAHRGSYQLRGADTANAAFVTPSFDLRGREGNVVVDVETDLSQSWVSLGYALIDETTGAARDFGADVSYYTGRDADGNWAEGSRRKTTRIARVPGGRYFLRVEADGPPGGPVVNGTLRVRRDVPQVAPFLLALLALLVPPLIHAIRRASFESTRWAESDHAPASHGDEDDE